MFPGTTVLLEKGSHVGHGAIIHGASLGENCLIGMNSVIMDDVVIGKDSIIAALTFVSSNTIIPERSLVVGNPGKVIKQVSDEMLAWKTEGTKYYQKLPKDCQNTLIACEALTEIEANRPMQQKDYFKFSK